MHRLRSLLGATLLLLLSVYGCQSEESSGSVTRVRVVVPAGKSPADASVVVSLASGLETRAFVDKDGYAQLRGLPPGSHLLNVFVMGELYPEFKLDVGRSGSLLKASYAHSREELPLPLTAHPAMAINYFETRPPFNPMSFLMSPYGLMIGFSLLAIFVFPMMKVDPEEYRQMTQQLSGGGGGGGTSSSSSQQQLPAAPRS